jgi:hypothetical protein
VLHRLWLQYVEAAGTLPARIECKAEMPLPTWTVAEYGRGIPTSCVIASASSSLRLSSPSATRFRSLPRS